MPERVGIGCAAQCQNMPGNKWRWRQEGNSGRREEGTGGDAERWTHRGADSRRVSHFCQESYPPVKTRTETMMNKKENSFLFHVMKSGGRNPGLIRGLHKVKRDSDIFFSPSCIILAGCMLSCFSHFWFFVTLWTTSYQAPLSMGFSRQEYWSGLPFPLQGIFLTQGSKLHLLGLLHCGWILHHWATREALTIFGSWLRSWDYESKMVAGISTTTIKFEAGMWKWEGRARKSMPS